MSLRNYVLAYCHIVVHIVSFFSLDQVLFGRMIDKVCKDPQMLVDVYVNYDCDLEAPNLFERMVILSYYSTIMFNYIFSSIKNYFSYI